MAVNKAIVLGFVGQDPKIDTLNNGSKVASLSLATTEKSYTTSSGTKVEERTDWHNIVAWGRFADIVEKWVKKGSQIYVEGKLRTRSYDDKNGVKRYVTEIQVENLQLLGSKQPSTPQEQSVAQPTTNPTTNVDIDDLPF